MRRPYIIKEAALSSLAKGLIGGGLIGGVPSLLGQNKKVATGQQNKINWGKVLLPAAIGSAVGGTIGHKFPRVLSTSAPIRGNALKTAKKSSGMKDYIKETTGQFDRSKARKLLRTQLRSKQISGKDFAKQHYWDKGLRPYLKEIGKDIAHPIKSLKRQKALITHTYDAGSKTLRKRSLLGTGLQGGMYWGIPAAAGIGELANQKYLKKSEGKARGLAEFASMATPKILPYMALTSLPGAFYKPQKKQTEIKMQRLSQDMNL